MNKIELIEDNMRWDVADDRFYRRAVLNTLINLKVKTAVEIGTYTYQTSNVFSYYFDKYQPDGFLVTADVSTWNRGCAPSRVQPVMVYPHVKNIHNYHGGIDIYHKDFAERLDVGQDSKELNLKIISSELNGSTPDLIFIDGCHTTYSFMNDLFIAKELSGDNTWLLIDDVRDNRNEQEYIYRKYLKPKNEFYEFDDWSPNPGMALIKASEFTI